MYRVLIVDDEMLVRIGIRSLIKWSEKGFEIVGEAANGEVAYEKYLALKPDVVITDIKMPKKDGLWLTDKIKENNPDAEIIFLTCYDDFEYARAALHKKVSSYILKAEMEEEELSDIMEQIKVRLDRRQQTKNLEDPEQQDTRKQEEHLLAYILDTRKNLEEVKQEFEDYHIEWKDKKYLLVQFDFNACLKDKDYDKTMIANIIAACKEVIINKFTSDNMRCMGKQFGKSITCLLIATELTVLHLKKDMEYIVQSIKQYFNIKVKSASSEIADSIEQIRSEVPWIYEASNLLFYEASGTHLEKKTQISAEEQSQKTHAKIDTQNYARQMCEHIEEGDEEGLMESMEELRGEILHNAGNSFDVKFNVAQLISEVEERFKGYLAGDIQEKNFQQDIMYAADLDELMEIMQKFCSSLLSLLPAIKFDNSDLLVEKATRYIEENYKLKITLDDVARYIGISKYYLSVLFKKERNINFSTYINVIRIEKAKELLRQPQMTINQVYSEVGFNDQQYFSKTFKKYVGMTVTEFRAK